MEWIDAKENIAVILKKYRWAVLVLFFGILLMVLPGNNGGESTVIDIPESEESQSDLQSELELLLSHLEGAGEVKVMLSQLRGPQTFYQMDEDQKRSGEMHDRRVETVVITTNDRNESGLVQRIDPPVYCGAIVLCQGADRASVRLSVIDAVSAVTGLTSEKICVLKMN